jgi:O-antigen ligase
VPALILCLPLEFTSQIFRLQLARIVLLVVAVAFLYLVLAGGRAVVVPVSVTAAVLAAYVCASIVSWLWTRAPGSLNPLLDVTAYPVTALLLVNLVRSEQEVRNAWLALIASAALFAVLGAFLYVTHLSIWRPDLTGLYRVNATFGDPNIAARFLCLAVCAAILMFAAGERRTWLVVAAVVACSAVMPLTFSKSGYLVFPVAVVLMAPFGVDRRRAAAVAALALAVFVASIVVNPSTRDRAEVSLGLVSGTTANGGSNPLNPGDVAPLAGGRLDTVRTYLIEAGWAMFRDRPITGVGYGGFQHALLTRYARFVPPNPPVTLSHTSAITIAAEQGLVGIVLFGGFLALFAWEAIAALRRSTAWRNWIVMPALLVVPILILSQFEGRLIEEPYLWVLIGLAFAAKVMEGTTRTVQVARR